MVQKEYSTKRARFQHLTSEKRAQIEILLRMKEGIFTVQIMSMLLQSF